MEQKCATHCLDLYGLGGIGLLNGRSARFLVALLLIAVALISGLPSMLMTAHADPYPSYTYDFWGNPVPAPLPYLPKRIISGDDIGVGPLNQPRDLFVDSNRNVYIVDTGNNRLVCLDENWNLRLVVSEFMHDSQVDRFRTPLGIFVTDDGHIFVADRGNSRVVELDDKGRFIRQIGEPQRDIEGLVAADFVYRPFKVAVDRADRVYVLAEGVYDGVMVFDLAGNFRGFIGSPRVKPTIADIFWKRFATEEQRERMALFLPTEYNTIDLDQTGFLYACEKNQVRRLNPAGTDVLRRDGFHDPLGDVSVANHAWQDASYFEDVVARESGIYSVLDRQRGRIFTYNSDGELLYVFGGIGNVRNLFLSPVAMDCAGMEVLVLDRRLNHIVVFEPTAYAATIHTALYLYSIGRYDESAAVWRRVLDMNSNYDQAYSGIGRAHFMKAQYSEAMHNFRLGNNRKGYSDAFRRYREQVVGTYFNAIALGTVCFVFVLWGLTRLHRARKARDLDKAKSAVEQPAGLETDRPIGGWLRQLGSGMYYAVYLVFHPFDGFDALKRRGRAAVPAATAILALVVLTYVGMYQYTGFIFNTRNLSEANVLFLAISVLAPFALWCAVNWSLTTLADGKGTLRDIYVATAYALSPIVIINIPLTCISNVLVQEEGLFYYLALSISLAWSLVLLLIAMMSIHEYSSGKAIVTSGLTVVGMGTVVYLGILFFSVINVIAGFASSIRTELILRL